MINSREIAMKVLYEIEYEGAYSNMALKKALRNGEISHRDKAFITHLVYGVTDKKITLDYIISKFSKIKLKKISKYILIILRMGVYQIKFMDKVPESAAVNECVKLARRYGHGASAGFVNGMLRNVVRSDIEYPKDKIEYMSVKYSVPLWLCKKWITDFGYEFTNELLKSFEQSTRVCVRPNTLKITEQELSDKLNDEGNKAEVKNNLVYIEGFDIGNDELYKKGYYTVQDEAAYTAGKVLAPKVGETVIDMCAAPGGKTTHLAEIMCNKGEIFAFDIHEHKIAIIQKNAERLGISIIKTEISDGSVFNKKYAEKADKILCDVPCSGLGIIRRKPEIKWNRNEDDDFHSLQEQILLNASKYLKKGGELVYSTCTINKEENEEVTSGFLKENSNFEKLYEKTFYPHIDNTDGFYICKIKRIR